MRDLLEFRSDDFHSHLGSSFTVRPEGSAPTELTLTEVIEHGAPPASGLRAPFALYFLGTPGRLYLAQGTWKLEHPEIGLIELFLVPLGPSEGQRMRYEAVFG